MIRGLFIFPQPESLTVISTSSYVSTWLTCMGPFSGIWDESQLSVIGGTSAGDDWKKRNPSDSQLSL